MLRPSLLRSDTQLNADSYYEASVTRPPAQPALAGRQRADVVVVGGGFAGLSAALELAERGRRVVLLEAERIGAGASGRNGGQAIVGYASGMAPFEAQLGRAAARMAWELSLEAVRLIDERIARHGIDCDRVHGYLYVADRPRKARALRAEMDALARDYGLASTWAEGAEVRRHIDSPRYVAAAYETVSGHLHPLKYALGLARAAQAAGAVLHEHSPVRRLQRLPDGVRVDTDAGTVEADFAVVAGNCTLPEHGPGVLADIHPRIMPVGTYILATEPLPRALASTLIPSRAAVCDNNVVLDYFRLSADDRLLFGGRVSYTTMTPRHLRDTLLRRLCAVFPQLTGVQAMHVWGGFVDITMNRAPDFGRVGHHIYYLQGFSGHGVALTGLAGRLVAEAITAQSERFDLFARLRHRDFPGGPWLRTPVLALGMAWHRWRDALGS
ncbi:Gamma-glutamylputrescine oxidoreductase [Tepidimonas thermarum]|uniref:Gamma-glutamylputrescine oxidoreductase n=1 Tax=Tepidimonas thermarum TaxID=335431 RepID=A0A554X2V4_9BURK|nr:FAD-binding oxidoreductase [Tepidimonas thermarum]TSE30123.1 Gamma-glutamylputrescine oxidoreductase [Tepidimonas thermarum]